MIDMRSDTVTRPTSAMRSAMASAEVGDDVLDGDPTVRRLEARVAELLGKEAGVFFPTGTMANQAAVWVLTEPGTEIIVDSESHVLHYELAGAAALSGVQVKAVQGKDGGIMDADSVSRAFRPASPHYPEVSLVCVENTHNGAGGRITPLEELRRVQNVAYGRGIPVHMDGARLWNASAASGTSLAEFASCADTVMVSFAKGLGAPVGAALVGTQAHMTRARIVRKRLGGGMRQSGILAAGVLHGLDHHMERLDDDHRNARIFASIVDGKGGARVVPPDTNIVMVDVPATCDAAALVKGAAERGVLIATWSATRIRAVTHLDVSEAQVRAAATTIAELLAS